MILVLERKVLVSQSCPTVYDSTDCSSSGSSIHGILQAYLTPGSGDPLEKVMATHSSILAWRIPWTEEPDGLQSVGLQRVGQD